MLGEAGARPALSRNCIPELCDRGARLPPSALFLTTFAAKGVERNLQFAGCKPLPLLSPARGFLFSGNAPAQGRFFVMIRGIWRIAAGIVLALWLSVAGELPAARADDPAERAVIWLHTQQLPDGSFGLRASDGSYAPSASATADVVYVLALAGEDPAGAGWTRGGNSALNALARLAPGYVGQDAGQAGKVARAATVAGGDPRSFGGLNLVQIIQDAYDPRTGRYHPALLYRHSLAVEGLLRAGETVPKAALTVLWQAQLPDGGWFWSFEGAQSDIDSTGRVLYLLAGQAGVQNQDAIARAARYLSLEQASTGGWGVGYLVGPPNTNSTALAVTGLRTAGCDLQSNVFRKAGRSPLETLLGFQEPSGAFVYTKEPGKEENRLMATVDAVNALLSASRIQVRSGETGLVACQPSGGKFGQRPLPYRGLRRE